MDVHSIRSSSGGLTTSLHLGQSGLSLGRPERDLHRLVEFDSRGQGRGEEPEVDFAIGLERFYAVLNMTSVVTSIPFGLSWRKLCRTQLAGGGPWADRG